MRLYENNTKQQLPTTEEDDIYGKYDYGSFLTCICFLKIKMSSECSKPILSLQLQLYFLTD